MKSKPQIIIATAGLLIIGIVFFWFRQPIEFTSQTILSRGFWPKSQQGVSLSPNSNIPIPLQLDEICAELKASKDPATTREILAKLRMLLNSLPPAIASREVQNYLATDKDASTKLDITIKPGGLLGDPSSLRVFLLDYLGLVDKLAAGQVAMQILSQYTTPDEWAVSLRNYAWANPGNTGQIFLQDKVSQLLANSAWAKDPSVGFLEAFDTIVYSHDTSLTPPLATMLRATDNHATAHAAFLTMDRLVINDTTPMLKQIVDQPDLMVGREQTRADFVARADLANTDQRALVEQYLLDPTRDPQELATFAAIFPNANFMISNNLLTPTQTPSGAELIQRNQDALAVVEQWQQDPRFAGLQPQLAQMQQRLVMFVKEAASNNH